MAIFLTKDSRIIVQGMTGSEGRKHTQRMLDAGSQVVGGVTPGKAGQTVDFNGAALPVFGSVSESMAATGADVSVVFVPPRFAKAAVSEAIDAGIGLVVVITEGIPVHDTVGFCAQASSNPARTRVVGPNCPGVISPGASNAGIIPADITGPGRIGLVSKSGTLTYQMMFELRDIGFFTCVGIGGDLVIGITLEQYEAGLKKRAEEIRGEEAEKRIQLQKLVDLTERATSAEKDSLRGRRRNDVIGDRCAQGRRCHQCRSARMTTPSRTRHRDPGRDRSRW